MSEARPDHLTWRHRLLALVVALALAALVVRLWQIQVRDHHTYASEAAAAHQGAITVPAPRGAILDASGFPLATSIDTWDIYLDSFLWRDRTRARAAAEALGAFLGRDPDELLALGTAQDAGDVLLMRSFDYARGRELAGEDLWGVRLLPSSRRVYPEGDISSALVGYVGLGGDGLWGVEADYDYALRGRDGLIIGERDPLGRPIAFGARTERAPAPGGEVQLTLDRFIQRIAETHLARAVEEYDADGGAVVVMNPQTGAVLAMASAPAAPLAAVDLDDPDLQDLVRNRPLSDMYEPGSVLKTLTTAAAIDLGLVTPQSTYVDTGLVEVGGFEIRNWDFAAHGPVTVTEYLQQSLNTGAVWLAELIGERSFYDYLAAFGIGEPTYVDLTGEAEGLIRRPSDPGWSVTDLATNSYGQGLAATPLQVLTAVNAFANGGYLMRPYVVSQVVSEDDVRVFEPVQVRQVVSTATAQTMGRLMLDVVEGVEWHGARVPGYRVAGKTGTTLVSIPTGYDLDTTIASFAGFLPYEAPAISVLVKIDRPGGDLNLGGQVAAPVFAGIAADIMEYLEIPPDDARGMRAP